MKYKTAHDALQRFAAIEPFVDDINELMQEHGAGMWGEKHMSRAHDLLFEYIHTYMPRMNRLGELVNKNQQVFGDPPAGELALDVLIRWLEKELPNGGRDRQ